MIDLSRYHKAFSDLPPDIEAAEVNAEKITKTALNIKGGDIADGRSGSVTKFYVRATEGQTGLAYTEKIGEDPADVIRRAAESASFTADAKPQAMNHAHTARLGTASEAIGVEDAIAFGVQSEKCAREIESIASVVGCEVNLCSREMRTVNSHGLDIDYQSHWVESLLHVTMKRGGRHTPGEAYFSGCTLRTKDAKAFAEAAAKDGNAYDGGGLAPCTVPSGRYPAVLSGRVMRNILMTAWQTLSGQAMLAGESPFKHEPGTRIGSDMLHIINAPLHPMLGQEWLADSEGTVIHSTRLVENGLLRTPLYMLGSGSAAGMQSTGSAGRIARMTGTTPITLTTVPSILYVEPGGEAQEALLRKMGTGILLTYSLDLFHSVNIASGEFSIPCGGVWYQDGKPAGFVSQMTVAGNLKDLFLQIDGVAGDLDFDNFYLESYTIGSPSVSVRGLSFSS